MRRKEIKLSTGAIVTVDEDRVRVDLPATSQASSTSPTPPPSSYNAMSSAILNGGNHSFPSESDGSVHVINYKVPGTYNGYNPKPEELLSNFSAKEGIDAKRTVGLLTAASMRTFSTASRSAQGVYVDVIVTAGLSNARAAGSDADYFLLTQTDDEDGIDKCDNSDNVVNDNTKGAIKPGTINTIVIINTRLTSSALAEAYAIAIEAKCGACIDHSVGCAKNGLELAQGTGTDCCVLLCPSTTIDPTVENRSNAKNNVGKGKHAGKVIKHAGKHTLFAEMLGQAVREATSEAIMINIRFMHGNYFFYSLKRWIKAFFFILQGARPCIPPYPMMPIPNSPSSIVLVGIFSVLFIYTMPLSEKVKLLLGAVVWDRYLNDPPLKIHPVCLIGSAISAILKQTPDTVFRHSILGFLGGILLLVSMLVVFIPAGWLFLRSTDWAEEYSVYFAGQLCPQWCCDIVIKIFIQPISWMLKLMLFKSTFSLQLLCTIALQMSKFLERKQIDEARMQLSWLCSRDPSNLGMGELAGGTLESLSENLSDGFTGPLFYYVLLGPLGALTYRVVNTLDSRVGYRGKYEWFGKASARFDDLINLVPARITAILLAMAACFVRGCNATRGIEIAWTDHGKCSSPNAGWPMACFAGILGVRLEKKGEYCLGSGPAPGPENIIAGHRVAQIAGALILLCAVIGCYVVA